MQKITPPTNMSQMNWLSKTPSERELERLQRVYGQLRTNNKDVTPIWRTSVRLSCGATNAVATPRCSIARVLGNQFSKQNMVAGQTLATSNAQNDVVTTPMVLKGRMYGNQQSLQNVQAIQTQRQQQLQQQHCNSSHSCISNSPTCFGNYYNLKNRLILLDDQRIALTQLYGRDRFLNEYTDLLQQCWHFEQLHKNVLPFAQEKIKEMLAEMKNCTVVEKKPVEQKPNAVKRPVTPVPKDVVRRNVPSIPSKRNTTPVAESTKNLLAKASVNTPKKADSTRPDAESTKKKDNKSGGNTPKTAGASGSDTESTKNKEKKSGANTPKTAGASGSDVESTKKIATKSSDNNPKTVEPFQATEYSKKSSIDLFKRQCCTNLVDLDKNGSHYDCEIGAAMLSNIYNDRSSYLSLSTSLNQTPSEFQRETSMDLSGDLLGSYLIDAPCTEPEHEPERTQLESLPWQDCFSNLLEKKDEFISIDKNNLESHPLLNAEVFQNNQNDEQTSASFFKVVVTPKSQSLKNCNIASVDTQIDGSNVDHVLESEKHYRDENHNLGSDNHLETSSYKHPIGYVEHAISVTDKNTLMTEPAGIPTIQTNPSKLDASPITPTIASSCTLVQSLVKKFSNIK